jgi:hypothetical protein
MTFATVRRLAADLPDVEEATMYGSPALKLGGRMLACIAINKVAEPNTLVVAAGFDQRDALIEEEPDVYYLKDHYRDYPCVLVRLTRVDRDVLRALLHEAARFVREQVTTKTRRKRATRAAWTKKRSR